MHVIYPLRDVEVLKFARDAEDYFADNPSAWTYTENEVEDGELFAVRWGTVRPPAPPAAILVFRIGEPRVYGDMDHDRAVRLKEAS